MYHYDTKLCYTHPLQAFEAIRRLLGASPVLEHQDLETIINSIDWTDQTQALESYAALLRSKVELRLPPLLSADQNFPASLLPIVDLANLQIFSYTRVGVFRLCWQTNEGVRLDFKPVMDKHMLLSSLDTAALLLASLASDQSHLWLESTVDSPNFQPALELAKQSLPERSTELAALLDSIQLIPEWEKSML